MESYVLVQQLREPGVRPIRICLTANEVSVGRRVMQTALARFPQVSRDHALFYKSNAGIIFVKDLNSSNGVYVNGVKIEDSLHEVKVGDSIGFGVASLEERNGFVCILTKEVRVKPEVIDLIEDEDQDAALSNLAINSNHGNDISMRLIPNGALEEPLHNVKNAAKGIGYLKNGMAPLLDGVQSTSSNSYALNRTDAPETPGPSIVELSLSSESDDSNHSVIEHHVNNTLLNKIKSPATSVINSCASGSSSTNKSDTSKHVVGVEHNINKTSALNTIKTFEYPGISKLKSCTADPSSTSKSDYSKHGVQVKQSMTKSSALHGVEYNINNASALNTNKVSEYPGILNIKSCTAGPSPSNQSDHSKHGVEVKQNMQNASAFNRVEHSITNTSVLKKVKTSETPEISKSTSCRAGPRSSKIGYSKHGVEVKQNTKNTSASNEIKISDSHERLKLKYPPIDHSPYGVDIPLHGVVQNPINTSASLQMSGSSKGVFSVYGIEWKKCKVVLEKCDSENFKYPAGLKHPFKKQKIGKKTTERDALLCKKKKRIRKLSDSSEDSLENNIAKNATQKKHKKIKIVSESVFQPSNDPFVPHESSEDAFSDTSVRNVCKKKSQILEQNSCKLIEHVGSYSQDGDDIITISDDEIYLDSQNYVPIKEEPPDVQEDIDNVNNEDALSRQIFDFSENEPSCSKSSNFYLSEPNTLVESVENISAFIGSSKGESSNKVGKNDENPSHESCEESDSDSSRKKDEELFLECEEIEDSDSGRNEADSDSSDEELGLQPMVSAKLTLGSSVVANSEKNEAHAIRDRVDNSVNSIANESRIINKSTGRTLLTEPKPLQQRSRKMRGREEGFIEQKKYQQPNSPIPRKQPQRSSKSSKPSPKKLPKRTAEAVRVQIGNANSGLKNFKIPRKSEVQNKNKMLKENEPFTNSKQASSANSRPSVSAPKKIPPVKSRSETFSSRIAPFTKEVQIKPVRKGKPAVRERNLNNLKSVNLSSAEKQNHSNNIPVPILQEMPKNKNQTDKSPNNVSNHPNKEPVSINLNKDTPDNLNLKSNYQPSSRTLKTPTKSSVTLNFSNLKDQDTRKHTRWLDPSTSNVSKPPNKEPVPSSEDALQERSKNKKPKDNPPNNVSKHPSNASHARNLGDLKNVPSHSRWDQPTRNTHQLRSNDQSASRFSHILNNAPVPLNPRDPRQVKTKDVKTRAQEVKQNSINFSSISSSQVASTSSLTAASISSRTVATASSSTAASTFPLKTTGFKRPTSSNRTGEKFEISYLILAKKLINLRCIWLEEQVKLDSPPPEVTKGASALPLHFKSYDSYVSSFYPMMMLEIWDCMYTESKEVFTSKNRAVNKFYFSLLQFSRKSDCIELKCESIVAEKVSYSPREGSMVILELKDASAKNIQHVFGYIFKHSVEKLNTSSSKISKSIQNFQRSLPKEWLTNAKHWSFDVYVKKRDMHPVMGTLMKANGICYIRSKLRVADALGQLKNSPLMSSIIEPSWETFEINYPESNPLTREYTSCQVRVISGIFSEIVEKSKTQPKIVLVQGPPGTGKTHTIVGLLERLVRNCKQVMRILVVAPSNAAVDEIGCRLIDLNDQNQLDKPIQFVRVGSEKQIHKKILPYFLDFRATELFKQNMNAERMRRDKDMEDMQKEINENSNKSPSYKTSDNLKYLQNRMRRLKEKKPIKEMDYHTEMSNKRSILKQCNIVLSTLNSCGLSILSKTFKPHSDVQFSCCIMDESTQCTELEVLQPLMFGIDKLVLVGDHEQLPATVTSKLACKYGFTRSMFERFHLFFKRSTCKSPVFTLHEQFRMHSEICSFPSKHFYNKMLTTDPETDIRYRSYPINPYVVLDIMDSQETSELSSKQNCDEASVIVCICKNLLNVIDCPSSIGIITPYQAQRSLYESALHQNPNYRAIEINTVDGFQGREKEVIIMSCVRANSHSGSIGFLGNRNRLNVAITRAKKCLIICCHTSSLLHNPDWSALITDAHSRNVLHSITSPKDVPHVFERYIKKRIQM